LERKQEGRGEIKEKTSWRRIETGETKPAMTFSMAEEATIASTGDNRACSNRRGRENKYGGVERIRIRSRTECRGSF